MSPGTNNITNFYLQNPSVINLFKLHRHCIIQPHQSGARHMYGTARPMNAESLLKTRIRCAFELTMNVHAHDYMTCSHRQQTVGGLCDTREMRLLNFIPYLPERHGISTDTWEYEYSSSSPLVMLRVANNAAMGPTLLKE